MIAVLTSPAATETNRVSPERPPAPRLGIAVIGKDVEHNDYPLFRKFRPHGTYFYKR
jgi:hypothetical protein